MVTFPTERTFSPISPPSTQQPSLNQWTKRKRSPSWRTRTSTGTVLPGRGTLLDLRSSVWRMPVDEQIRELRATMRRLLWKMLLWNKYGLKKPGDFTVSEGHKYPLVHLYYSTRVAHGDTWHSNIISISTLLIN